MTTERPFYDLIHDASPASKELADALTKAIEDFKQGSTEIKEHEVMDAIKLVSLRFGS